MVTCPKCNADIDVEEEDLDEGEQFICEECAANIVVVGVDPLDLELDKGVDEDDEEEDFDEEEEEEEEEEESEDDDDDWR